MRSIHIILIFMSFQFMNAQINQEVLSLITESKIYLERKKYSEAFSTINEALSLDNQNFEAYFVRAEINFAINKYEEALKDYENAIDNNKMYYPQALNGKILSMTFLGNIKEALDIVDKAIELNPTDPDFYYSRGIINTEREKYSKAIEDFDKALSLGDDNEFRIFLYRGVAKLSLEQYDSALEDLNSAIEMDPKNASAYHSRGRVYYELREYNSAIKDFETSLKFNPQNEVAYYNLGMAYYRLGDMEEACKHFHESCSMEFKHACKMIVVECNEK